MGVDLDDADDRAAHEAAILGVLKACRETGKIPGLACVPQNAQYWLDKGFRFVTVGGESTLLRMKAEEVLTDLGRL
jgi:2-keto-3-deoxy-L-rhamnonate aldolase RhmA